MRLQSHGRNYVPTEGGKQGHVSYHSCDHKTRVGITYRLEAEREDDMSDCDCDYEMGAGTTYSLETEMEGNISDRGCDYKQD